ncbi:hypothetical protein O1Q_14440, partial [Pseudomonas aeruginosa MPAO1/P2]
MTMTFQHDDLPLALYSAAQVRDLDARLIAAGTPGFELMQRAAHAAWRALRRRWPEAAALTVLAGHGNNAGDGYLIAALAQRAGWRVRVLAQGLQGPDPLRDHPRRPAHPDRRRRQPADVRPRQRAPAGIQQRAPRERD